MKAAVLCFVLLTAASQMAAQTSSERPVARPGSTSSGTLGVQVEQSGSIRQIRRGPDAEEAIDRGRNLNQSERPSARTPGVELTARQQRRLLAKGAVCEDIEIQGKVVGQVPGRIPGCGIEGAVRITSVSGIALSQPSVIDCPTAAALKTWINQSVKPALRDIGGGVQSLRVAAHYACRTRNNQPGARISEHGKGRAIDISGFNLKDGSSISVLKGWNARATAQAMRKMHRGACGPFGTVLGPESDSFHRDHFHFDTARYRSGPYCR